MVTDFFHQIPPELYGWFLFGSVFIENIFPPYPGDTIVVFAGYLVGTKNLNIINAALAIYIGNLLSASLMYYFGHEILEFIIKKVKNKNIREVFSKKHLERTHIWFEKHGLWAVIFSRFSAGIRFFVAIAAGIAEMPFGIFFFAFSIATAIWNTILVYAGYTLGKNWDDVLGYVKLYSSIFGVILVLALMVYLFRVNKNTGKKRKE
jgi:membrane protein DedA with SNARE-associated domain